MHPPDLKKMQKETPFSPYAYLGHDSGTCLSARFLVQIIVVDFQTKNGLQLKLAQLLSMAMLWKVVLPSSWNVADMPR